MLIWMRFPAVTSFLLTIACICVICIYLSYIFCLSFCLTVHYHVVISDKEEIKSIYTEKVELPVHVESYLYNHDNVHVLCNAYDTAL